MIKENLSSVTILHDTQEWTTRFENLKDVQIDGQKIMQIHDLAKNVNRQNKQVRILATIATTMAVIVLVILSSLTWHYLNHNHSTENRRLASSSAIMGEKLKTLGWVWKDGDWRQIANSAK